MGGGGGGGVSHFNLIDKNFVANAIMKISIVFTERRAIFRGTEYLPIKA